MDYKRPIPVTVLSIILIVIGIIALIGGLLQIPNASPLEISIASSVRLIAVVSGVFMLKGQQWARWLCIAWFVYHVILSIWHTRFELIAHCVFAMIVFIILFSPPVNAYFRTR
jgi:uncharacterized membrane protein